MVSDQFNLSSAVPKFRHVEKGSEPWSLEASANLRWGGQALNDLFEKILERDVPARYLLRLGMGEQELATTLDFSRVGRVNAMLARRLELLAEVCSAQGGWAL